MTRILLFLWLLNSPALAGNFEVFEQIRQMKAQGKLPGLASDGVLLPQALILDKLKESVNSDKTEIKELLLTPEKGTIKIVSHGIVDAFLTIDFKFAEVDWKNRTVWVDFSESAGSASDNVVGRLFGAMAISLFEAATGGDHVKHAMVEKPYVQFKGNRAGIMLDKIPALKDKMDWGVGNHRLFDYIGIKRIVTEEGRIRVSLGLI